MGSSDPRVRPCWRANRHAAVSFRAANLASFSDRAIGDAVANAGPHSTRRTAFGAFAGWRLWFGGPPRGGRTAVPACATCAWHRRGRHLDTSTAHVRAGGEKAGNNCISKHGLCPGAPGTIIFNKNEPAMAVPLNWRHPFPGPAPSMPPPPESTRHQSAAPSRHQSPEAGGKQPRIRASTRGAHNAAANSQNHCSTWREMEQPIRILAIDTDRKFLELL